jgi:D-tyrosyl-tRNA(Tyr) deacylase
MRAVIQRVKQAKVEVDGRLIGQIGRGILLFLGIAPDDDERDIDYLVNKVAQLRIFPEGEHYFHVNLRDIQGELLIVSQFTLYGDCRQGRRPDFINAAKPDQARQLYQRFVEKCQNQGLKTATGEFQAMMDVSLVNDGPVTFLLESKKLF